jgi:hypothetical protein
MIAKKLKLYPTEKVVVLPFKKSAKGNRYAVTNYGRMISFTDKPINGHFLKPGVISNYPGISFRSKPINKSFLIHRLVASHFLKKPSKQHKFVIHLNYKRNDNYYKNLKWATLQERATHQRNNPNYTNTNTKLTEKQVLTIKQKLSLGKTTLKQIALKFGISDMQVHRIKTGENWGSIKI